MTHYTELLIDPLVTAEIVGLILTSGYLIAAFLRLRTYGRSVHSLAPSLAPLRRFAPLDSLAPLRRFAPLASLAPRRTLHTLRTLAPQEDLDFIPGRLLSSMNTAATNLNPVNAMIAHQSAPRPSTSVINLTELQLLRDYKLAIQSHLARFFEVGRLISSPKRSLTGQRVARFA